MADDIDRAQDLQLQMNELALRKPKTPTLAPIGICYYCSEAVPGQQLYCDGACADDHAAEQEARRRNGG